jgi:hypothetical protein
MKNKLLEIINKKIYTNMDYCESENRRCFYCDSTKDKCLLLNKDLEHYGQYVRCGLCKEVVQ